MGRNAEKRANERQREASGDRLRKAPILPRAAPRLYNRVMLVKFDSKVGTLTMFGDVAVELLKTMGHSGTVPSAILAADLPPAVARLEAVLARMPSDARSKADIERKDEASMVSLRHRAFPLIQLCRRAAEADADLLWDEA